MPGSHRWLALALMMGVTLGRTSFASPIDPWNHCRTKFTETKTSQASARCFYSTAAATGHWRIARTEIETLLTRDPGNVWLLYYLGHVVKNLRWDDPRVEVLYREAADRFRAADDGWGETLARKALQDWLLQQDRFQEASRQIEILERSVGNLEDPKIQARLDFCRAKQLLEERRDLQQASIFLDRAEPHIQVSSLLRALLNNRGIAYLQLGKFTAAQRDLERALSMARAANDRQAITTTSVNLTYAVIGRYKERPSDEARLDVLQTTQGFLKKAENFPPDEALAKIHLELGRLLGAPKGEEHFQRCSALAREIRRPDVEGECLAGHARAVAQRNFARAQLLAKQAREAARIGNDPRSQAFVLAETSHIYWHGDSKQRAIREHLDTLQHIEHLLEQQTAAHGKASSFSEWTGAYQALIGYLLEEYRHTRREEYLERAFHVSERMRARVLQEALRRGTKDRSPLPDLAQERAEVLQHMQEVNRTLLAAPLGTGERSRWLEALEDLERQLDDIQYRINKASRKKAPPPQLSFASLRNVQVNLRPDEALLSFQVAPRSNLYGHFGGASWVLVITEKTAGVYGLPPTTSLGWRIPSLLNLIRQRDVQTRALIPFYKELLDAAVAGLPETVTSLILIPDGILHSFPFGILRSSSDEAPLAARYRITRAPSATLWLQWRRAEHDMAPSPALVLADPRALGQVSDRSPSQRSTSQIMGSGGLLRGQTIAPLPLAREEGRKICQYLGRKTVLRQGVAATEKLVKTSRLRDYQIIHFAAHAQADHSNPERAGIHLTPDPVEKDGLLQFREIVDLDLDGRVVVLSACDTATGEILRGEGVLDLARAFFQAGAHAVVASLWPLRDDDGRDFFDAFYRHLAEGKSLAGALQGAQVDRIGAEAPPAAWAGIVVLGDGSMVPFPDAKARLPFLAVALLALGIFSLAVVVATITARR